MTVAEKNEDPMGNPVDKEDDGHQPNGDSQDQDQSKTESNSSVSDSESSPSSGNKEKGGDGSQDKLHPAEHNKHPSVSHPTQSNQTEGVGETKEKARRHARGDEPFEKWEREEMENLLHELNGQLGAYCGQPLSRVLLHIVNADFLNLSAIPHAILGRRRYRK
jgi:hypothetical protein